MIRVFKYKDKDKDNIVFIEPNIVHTEYKESRAELCHCQAVTVLLLTFSVVMENWQKKLDRHC